MEHFYGSQSIMVRIGISGRATLYNWIRKRGFPCYPVRRPGSPRKVLYASEAMIAGWELGQAALHREQLLGKDQAKQEARNYPKGRTR